MTSLDTKISNVVIYRDGARVTRTGRLNLAAGTHKVTVEGITQNAREDSFRVKGRGDATLSSIDVNTETKVFEPEEDTKKLHDKLRKLEEEAKEIQDEMVIQQGRLAQLQAIQEQFSSTFGMVIAANEGKPESLVEMDEKVTETAECIMRELRQLDEKATKIQDKMDVIRSNLGEIESTMRTETSFSVVISLDTKQQTDIVLELSYQTTGAGWRPSYDVDLSPGRATLRRIAQLRNRTGEDWTKVNLTVSTATARPAEAIEATPYYISAYDPELELRRREKARERTSKMKKRTMAASMGAAGVEPPAPPELEEEYADAIETVSGIAIYELPTPMTVPSDHDFHPVTLTEEELESETVYHWYPDGMSEVIAQDMVTNGDTVILPGDVKVFAESDYIGETSFDLISPREEFKIGTRIANDVKGKKKLALREVEKAGVMRGKLRMKYGYRLEVENFSKKAIEIDIYDRVPHSLSTAIEVKVDWEKLGVEKHELGVLQWHRSIQPGAKEVIEYEYEVEWEKDVTLSPPLP
ncbi:MAG: hypothetical protein DRP09_10865 [Candidatus Thorarchaeota archaeon]|nr:MAG: hypothetical protein DRP09_10865 [Candidatus Thorarchaeota archaeon]